MTFGEGLFTVADLSKKITKNYSTELVIKHQPKKNTYTVIWEYIFIQYYFVINFQEKFPPTLLFGTYYFFVKFQKKFAPTVQACCYIWNSRVVYSTGISRDVKVDHVTDKRVVNPKYRITSIAGPRPHVVFIHLFLWMSNGLKSILNSDSKEWFFWMNFNPLFIYRKRWMETPKGKPTSV